MQSYDKEWEITFSIKKTFKLKLNKMNEKSHMYLF